MQILNKPEYPGVKPTELPVAKSGGTAAGVFMYLATVACIILFVAGMASTAGIGTALFAASAVCGILARIFQAASHHAEVLAELRRR